jgi:periplasmic divalent cation tolerance protein
MSEGALVLITAPNAEVARMLARTLVEERLAACGNVVSPIQSVYRWEGRVEESTEALLFLKTRTSLFEAICARVAALHPYQVPAIVQVGLDAGHPPYLRWLLESTGSASE